MLRLTHWVAAALSAAILSTGMAHAGDDERRVALVVGNGAYEHAPSLKNPVADAKAMGEKLASLGFEVVEGYDLDYAGMNATLRDFTKKLRRSDLSVFFYAGHGVAHAGTNYLVPVDARFRDATQLVLEAVPAELITNQMQYSDGVNLVFLDACRDNPLNDPRLALGSTRSLASERGLSGMSLSNAGEGLAIAFATSPGQVAQDGSGKHSPFTDALLRHIGTPGLDITSAMTLVTGDVLEATDQQQRPWLNTSLTGRVFLNRAVDPAPLGGLVATSTDAREADEASEVASADGPSRTMGEGQTEVAALPDALAPAGGVAGGGAAPDEPRVEAGMELGRSQPGSVHANLEAQELLWRYAEKSGEMGDYRAYLQTFPNGLFAPLAKTRMASLETEEEEVAAASQPSTMPSEGTASPYGEAAPAPVVPYVPPVATATNPRPAWEPGPLTLNVTPVVRAKDATLATERALQMDRDKAREVQHRLNLAGYDVGPADGLFGPRTRGGISAFQKAKGLEATGYLNAVQLQILTVATAELIEKEPLVIPVVTPRRTSQPTRAATSRAASAPKRTKARSRAKSRPKSTKAKRAKSRPKSTARTRARTTRTRARAATAAPKRQSQRKIVTKAEAQRLRRQGVAPR